MTNKKYYYTCAIKALHMRKRFGIELYIVLDGKIEIIDNWCFRNHCLLSLNDDKKIYVAPESNHIFDLQENDIFMDNGFMFIVKNNRRRLFENKDKEICVEGKIDSTVLKNIIMRDGKHFFMPKFRINLKIKLMSDIEIKYNPLIKNLKKLYKLKTKKENEIDKIQKKLSLKKNELEKINDNIFLIKGILHYEGLIIKLKNKT